MGPPALEAITLQLGYRGNGTTSYIEIGFVFNVCNIKIFLMVILHIEQQSRLVTKQIILV